jgi:micrococcal nuclease
MKANNLSLILFGVIGLLIFVLLLQVPAISQSLNQNLGLQSVWEQIKSAGNIDGTSLNSEEVFVEDIIDGDTLVTNTGRRIRYLNVDTPETVKVNTPVMCYGKEAKAKNQELVEKKNIWLAFDKEKRDRYDRELAFIFLDKADAENKRIENSVNAKLVKGGFARAISYSPNTTYKNDFNAWMVEAQEKNKGVWEKCKKPFQA